MKTSRLLILALFAPAMSSACAAPVQHPRTVVPAKTPTPNAAPLQPDSEATSTTSLDRAEMEMAVAGAVDRERSFHPRSGIAIVTPRGQLTSLQLWEGDVPAERGCPTGLDVVPRGAAMLVVMPNVDHRLPRASGFRIDERSLATFSGRLFERNVKTVRAQLPEKLVAGAALMVAFEVGDDRGATYSGDVRLVVCDFSTQ